MVSNVVNNRILKENMMKSYLKKAAVLALLVVASAQTADLTKKIVRVERELSDILTAQKNATFINPEFNDDFDRKIAEKRQELQTLKAKLSK